MFFAMQAFIACYCAISLIKSVLERRNYFELETDGYYNRKAKVLQHYKNKSLYHFGKNRCEVLKKQLEIDNKRFIPTPSCFRDTTPRRTERWRKTHPYNFASELIWYISPEKYREVLAGMKKICDALPKDAWARKIIMIDNWNEWDEGHFVAPSHKYGFKFLQAIREVFTERENLPDYVTPQDQGFTGYNKSWKVPDFKDFCKNKM